MRTSCSLTVFILLTLMSFGQNPAGFDEMLGRMIKGTVPYISSEGLESLPDSNLYILDTREGEEYEAGHIPGAMVVGFRHLDETLLEEIPIGATIVTYCSIGYRSEKVGMRLLSMGHEQVYNLKGGIFDWVNTGHALADSAAVVHGYSRKWSKWVNTDRIEVVTDPVEEINVE